MHLLTNNAGEQPKPEAMRAFVLVSKVLQMLANGLTFSDKTSEAYICTDSRSSWPYLTHGMHSLQIHARYEPPAR